MRLLVCLVKDEREGAWDTAGYILRLWRLARAIRIGQPARASPNGDPPKWMDPPLASLGAS